MFSYACAHCGYREIYHLDPDDLQRCIDTDLWPDDEYQEEPDPEVTARDARAFPRVNGYRYSLHSCPGFTYRKGDKKEVVKTFRRVRDGMFIERMPEEWQKEAWELSLEDASDEDEPPARAFGHPVTTVVGYGG